ncbi:hypothetical protein KM043_006996 [Ampulex compressa]|nr:hypothetical protein KM043_006996 [Ampulex compressa]
MAAPGKWVPRLDVCGIEDTAPWWCLGPCLNRRAPSNIRVEMHESISRNQTYVPRHVECLKRWRKTSRKDEEERQGGPPRRLGDDKFCQTHERYLSWPLAKLPLFTHPLPLLSVRACSRELTETKATVLTWVSRQPRAGYLLSFFEIPPYSPLFLIARVSRRVGKKTQIASIECGETLSACMG